MENELYEFFYIHCVKLKEYQSSIFSFINSHFSFFFFTNATDFFIHSLNRFVLKKKATYTLLVFFNQVPFLFLVYANIPFKCLWTGRRKKSALFQCRINSFQNQNSYEHNFNIITTTVFLIVTWELEHILIKHRQLCSKIV